MPDAFVTRRQILLAAIESTYGTDAAPQEANSYQAIKLLDPFTLETDQEFVENEGGNLTLGVQRPIPGVKPVGITFRTFVQGISASSFTASIKPPIGDLLRACGLFESYITTGNGSYRYEPAADVSSHLSVTLVAHQDGFEHRILGARGNVNFVFESAKPVIAEFNFRGQLSTEAATTRSAPTGLPTVIPPRWTGSGTIIVESLAATVERLNLNTNNTVFEQRASTALSASGVKAIWLTRRQPGGSFDPEASQPSTLDFFAVWRAASGSVLQLQAGLTTGNIFSITASQTIFRKVGWGDKEGLSIFATDFQAAERNSNDEFRLTFS